MTPFEGPRQSRRMPTRRAELVKRRSCGFEQLEPRLPLTVNVLTWHNDIARDGLNSNETMLTTSNVGSGTFGQLFSYNVQGQVYGQPLYVSNLAIPGKGTHNVVFVVTENNDVYALDANSNAGASAGVLWHVNFGLAAAMPNNFFGNRYGPYHDINPQVGITSTPVIDLATGTMYIDSFTNDVAGQNAYSHHIHALDITTGADKMTPMLVSASVQGNGNGGNGTTIPFVATRQLQRPALTLLNGVLYVAYSGYADTDPYNGWILGFNPSNLQLVGAFNTTPNLLPGGSENTGGQAGEGGIWMTGAGPASDGTNMFLLVGNGDFSVAQGDYGDSALKISPDTSTAANPNINGYGMHVADYFTPFNEMDLASADADLGSGGGIVLPDQPGAHPHEYIGSGKQGVIYLLDRDSMGGHGTSDTGRVIQEINLGNGNFDTAAYFNQAVYYHGVNGVLKAYTLTNGLLSAAPAMQSTVSYNGSQQGATPSISANGTANGIVWDVQFSGTHQILHAYDATTLQELYNSSQNAARDQLGVGVKFITPTIADGEVFVGGTGYVAVFGLLTPPTSPPDAPSNLTAAALSATSVQLTWVNNATNQAGFKIERSTDGTNFTQIALAGASALNYVDTTANPSTTYTYRIRATNVIGDSAYAGPVNITTPAVTGAIGVYHLDAGSGTTAVDSAGTNNGALTGPTGTLPQWVAPGKVGAAALKFTGDGVAKSTNPQSAVQTATNLAPVLGATASLTAWIKTTQAGNNALYNAPAITGVEQAGANNDVRWGYLDASGHIGVGAGNGVANNAGVISTSVVNDGNWHFVAFTRDATTGICQVYVDGALQASGNSGTGNKTSTFRLIGAQSDVAGDGTTSQGATYFNGQLDEVGIYNRVLTGAEIQGLGVVGAPPVAGIVDLYHFNENAGTTTADSAGTNNGTLIGTGSTLPIWVLPGKIGTAALSFSGNGTYNQPLASQTGVTLANNLAPILGGTSSLAAWFKTTQVGNATHWQAPAITGVEQAGAGNDINWGTLDAGGHIGIYVADAGGVFSPNAVNDGQWHHVAMTRDATTGQVQLFIDGALVGTGAFDAGNKTSQFNLIGALEDVAADGVTPSGGNFFNGQLDEVRIYNQVLSTIDVQGLAVIPGAPTLNTAAASPGPVVHLAWTTPSNFTQSIEIDRKTGPSGTYAPLVTLGGGTTMYDDTTVVAGTQYFYVVKAIDLAGTSPASNELTVTPPMPTVVANSVFYNGSTFDGFNGSSNLPDTTSVPSNKQTLLPGQTATFQNVTSYSKGINGVLVDVANFYNLPRFEDYAFQVSTDGVTWTKAPDPSIINVYPGRGPSGSTQITIIWDDNEIQNEWLQVKVLADDHTGLANDDVFYIGNLVGATGADNTASAAVVGPDDATAIAAHPKSIFTKAAITDLYDINRDGQVNANDAIKARNSAGNSLPFISPPAPGGGGMAAAATTSVSTSALTESGDAGSASGVGSSVTSTNTTTVEPLQSATAAPATNAPAVAPLAPSARRLPPLPKISLIAGQLADAAAAPARQPGRPAVMAVWDAHDDANHASAWWSGHRIDDPQSDLAALLADRVTSRLKS